jgi:hypothetical protein
LKLIYVLGFLWIYVVPQWAEEGLERVSTKWRNTLLFLTYGEDFTNPPPLERDPSAVHPKRSAEEDEVRFHPLYSFRPSPSPSSSPFSSSSRLGSPPSSPSRATRRNQQQQSVPSSPIAVRNHSRDTTITTREESNHDTDQPLPDQQPQLEVEEEGGSVWDPTWGVISRELQVHWQKEEEMRTIIKQQHQQRNKKTIPPVRR